MKCYKMKAWSLSGLEKTLFLHVGIAMCGKGACQSCMLRKCVTCLSKEIDNEQNIDNDKDLWNGHLS